MSIPILNATDLGARPPAELVDTFLQAYAETGFAYLTHHGIAPELIAATFDASHRFHALPLDTKQAISLDGNHRGYIAIDTSTDVTSTLAKVTRPNQSASFMMMRDDEPDPNRFLSGHNQWPDLHGFRPPLEAYNDALTDLARKLMRVALAAIGADDGHMRIFDRPTTWLRLLHYPPQKPDSPDDLYGSAPHTDFGCLTILAQDEIGGLQVMTPKGDWIDVPPRPDAFIVNVGDMLHLMSNGVLRSTPHRVINRSGRARYSIPFFFDPDVTATVRPLCGTPKLKPVRFESFLRAQLAASYEAHKSP